MLSWERTGRVRAHLQRLVLHMQSLVIFVLFLRLSSCKFQVGLKYLQVLVGHPDYEVTAGSVVFKGENLLDMEPEERSLAGLFMSFQSPIEIPGVNNIDFLNMAYNARRRKLGLAELGPIEVYNYIITTIIYL